MSKKVVVNEQKVLELWSRGYSNAQVKASLGIKKSTWDRWYKEYKGRVTPMETPVTPMETPVTPMETPVTPMETPINPLPQWNPSTASNVGRGGVRYRYTNKEKFDEFRKEDAMRIMEQETKSEITHKPVERVVKPQIPEELLQYDQTDIPYEVWTKYIDESKGEHWGTFVMKYGRFLEPKKHSSVSSSVCKQHEKQGLEYFEKIFGKGGVYNLSRDSYTINGNEMLF